MINAHLFAGICGGLLTITAAWTGITLYGRRLRLMSEFRALTADMRLTENAAQMGYWHRDAVTQKITWSPGLFNVFGQDPESFKPTSEGVRAFFLPEYIQAVETIRDPEASARKGGEVEARIKCPDGRIKDVLVVIRFNFSKSGKLLSVFGRDPGGH